MSATWGYRVIHHRAGIRGGSEVEFNTAGAFECRLVREAVSGMLKAISHDGSTTNQPWRIGIQGFCRCSRKGVALLALEAAEQILRASRAVVEGPVYHAAMFGIAVAEGAVNLAREAVSAVINGMQAALDGVVLLYANGIDLAKAAVEAAQRVAPGIRQAAWAARDALYVLQQEALKAAEYIVEAVARGVEFLAFKTVLAALDFAKNDTTLIDIAKAGLDTAEAVAQAALKAASALADALMNTPNIELVELSRSLRAITGGGGAFTIRVKGIVCG